MYLFQLADRVARGLREVDPARIERHRDFLQSRQATEGGTDTVVLDLHHVAFIDSSGLGAIVAAMKHLAPDRKLVLAGLTPTVEKVFKLTRMDSVFSVFPTIEGALSELRG